MLGWYLWVTEGEVTRLIHRLIKLMQFCMSLIVLWSQNGSFQAPRTCQFLNWSLFRSIPMVINLGSWLEIYCLKWKRRNGIFVKSTWRDISRQSVQLWNSQSPECRNTSLNWEIPATLVQPCVQNAPQKTGKGHPRTRCSGFISNLAWSHLGVEPAELPEIAVDHEVFRVLLGLLSLQHSLEERWRWMNEWDYAPYEQTFHVNKVYIIYIVNLCKSVFLP